MPVARAALSAIEPAQRCHHIVDRHRAAGAWWATEGRLALDGRAIGRPGGEDGALHFGLKLRVRATMKGSRKERVCDMTYPPFLPRLSPKAKFPEDWFGLV